MGWRARQPLPKTAPPGFAAGVIAHWARSRTGRPFAASSIDLWEVLGLRGALASGAVAFAVLLLNFSTLRDIGPTLDAGSLNPTP